MAKLYPAPISPGTKSQAERDLYAHFGRQLDNGFTVFHSVSWIARRPQTGARDGEADFVIAHPDHGLLILEVKGGRIQLDGTTGQWSSTDQSGTKHSIKNPFEQARGSTYSLLDKLNDMESTKAYSWPINYAVAFPDIVVTPSIPLRPDTPRDIIIDRTDLDNLAAKLHSIYQYWQGQNRRKASPGRTGIEALVKYFAPTWSLRSTLAQDFEDEDTQIKTLTEQQFVLLDFLSRHRRAAIVGGAGTGKTMLALEKAHRLARENFDVLFVCFNRNLAEWIEETVADEPRILPSTFHSLAWKAVQWAQLQDTTRDDPPDDLILRALDHTDKRFDAIIVDEGQDFEESWWLPLEGLLRDDKAGIFYIFFDERQRLYTNRLSIPIEGEFFKLDINCRNTQAIHQTLLPYGDEQTRCIGPKGRSVEFLPVANTSALPDVLKTRLLQFVNQEQVDPSHIIILTPRAKDKSGWREGQKLGTLTLTWELKRKAKNCVRVSTIHSFKGLESPIVILTEMENAWSDELVYVGLSRARNHVAVLGSLPQPQDNGITASDLPTPRVIAIPAAQPQPTTEIKHEEKTMTLKKRPGGELATRPLHFIWIADCSGSMMGEKIGQLNFAIREAIPAMQSVARENVNAQVLVRAVSFSTGAQWCIAQPTPVDDFKWTDLRADGVTDMGKALSLVAEQLRIPPMTDRALPPVLVLVSDGQPTDNFNQGLSELMALPWGKRAVRMAIAIGHDADSDVLQKFVGNPEIKVMHANNSETLVKYVRWVSTVVLQAASSPASQTKDVTQSGNVIPQPVIDIDADDVW